jgi:hypothetical protein
VPEEHNVPVSDRVHKALQLVKLKNEMPMKQFVEDAIIEKFQRDPNLKKSIELNLGGLPWKQQKQQG